jgi:hypothetical protein
MERLHNPRISYSRYTLLPVPCMTMIIEDLYSCLSRSGKVGPRSDPRANLVEQERQGNGQAHEAAE